jgi:AcrR family transcriptional regulator
MDGEIKAARGGRAAARRGRRLDPDRTRQEILRVARAEFAEHGFSGARVDRIGARTATAKRMIYYYFGSKEGLYRAVLEDAYAGIRMAEATLDLDHLSPEAAMSRLIDFTFDYDRANVDFVRIVSGENTNAARFLRQSGKIRLLNTMVVQTIGRILARGLKEGVFVRRVEPLDLHFMISAMCFFRVSNQYTFSEIFGCDLTSEEVSERHKRMIREAVLAYLRHAD